MKRYALLGIICLSVAASGCREQESLPPPPPQRLTANSAGHFCGMSLAEHPGPKGQILLRDRGDAVWFSSARDAFAFTMLAEESKTVRAIYVSDMGKAPSWEHPGDDNWIDAHRAWFVIGSRKQGGMGAPETVPFADLGAAEKFMRANGGSIAAFDDVPQNYILGLDSETEPATGSAR